MIPDRIIIVGLGQIGTSIALGVRKGRLARRIIGINRDRKNFKRLHLGKNDFVILAVPVRRIIAYLHRLPRGPLIMDVGSTKRTIVREAERRRLRFVGAHPIAGTEKEGAAAGDPELFRGKFCFLTGTRSASQPDRRWIERFWRRLGARPVWIDPGRHDRLFGALSHLPHAAAYGLIRTVSGLAGNKAMIRFSLAGLKDTTRIAASSPRMWADIFMENRAVLLKGILRFQRELDRLCRLLKRGDTGKILGWLRAARRVRSRF